MNFNNDNNNNSLIQREKVFKERFLTENMQVLERADYINV